MTKPEYKKHRDIIFTEAAIYRRLIEAQQVEDLSEEEIVERENRRLEKMTPREIAYENYIDYFVNEELKDEEGNVDFDAAEDFFVSLPEEHQRYIQDKRDATIGRNLTPEAEELERSLYNARQITKPYWDIFDEILKEMGILERWLSMNSMQRALFEDTKAYRKAQSQTQKLRKQYRLNHPDVNKALIEWYGRDPLKREIKFTLPGLKRLKANLPKLRGL